MTKVIGGLVVAFSLCSLTLAVADEKDNNPKKAPKADVVIKYDATTGKAKAGQSVEVQVRYASVPPFPDDFEVRVDGKKVDAKAYPAALLDKGKPVYGSALKLVQFEAAGQGKQKVEVSYKRGDKKEVRKVELEVMK